jgi:hypothetical protein
MSDLHEILVSSFRVEPGGRSSSITDVLLSHPVYLIGSDARCQLPLADAQPVHAIVERKGDSYYIQARYPSADVHVNGKPVRMPIALHVGDQVQIGAHTLIFAQETRAVANSLPATVVPAAPPKPAVTRSLTISTGRSAPAPAPAAADTNVYYPNSEQAQQGSNIAALALGAVTLLLIIAVVGFGLVSGTSASGPAAVAVNQFAYNDGNITMIMFDADW